MTHPLIPVQVAQDWFLLDASLVREILGPEAWLPIPHARAELPGVLAWRGRAIPIVDLGPLLGFRRLEPRQVRKRTLIVGSEDTLAAVPVDVAREVQALEGSELQAAHARERPYAKGEAQVNGHLMPLIDLEAVLNQLTPGAGGPDGA